MLARNPEEATDLGLDDSRLNDLSPAYVDETVALARDALERIARVDPGGLSADERITLA